MALYRVGSLARARSASYAYVFDLYIARSARSLLAQSSCYWMTYKSSIQGCNKLDVVIWHSCRMLTWHSMELDCAGAQIRLHFG